MNPITYAFQIVAALLSLVAIVELTRRGTLRERHAVWWTIGAVLALVIAIFPQLLTAIARLLHVSLPSNLVFFIAIALLFLVSLQYGAELTRIEAKMRAMAEKTAFNEHRIERLERALAESEAQEQDCEVGNDVAADGGER